VIVNLVICPLTPDRWPALEDLFGARGAVNGCRCMYWRIGSAYRKRGTMSALTAAALNAAKRAGAPALEAYPLDANLTPSASGTGYASTFERAGFKVLARHVAPRPIMRHDLQEIELDAATSAVRQPEGQIDGCLCYRWEEVDGHGDLTIVQEHAEGKPTEP
jgi:hypothetical protein